MEAKDINRETFCEQLFQAYTDCLREDESSLGGEETPIKVLPADNESSLVSDQEYEETCPASLASISGNLEAGGDCPPRNVVASTSTAECPEHFLHESTIVAWDQIGDLANDITHSALVKQAEIVNELAKRDCRVRLSLDGKKKSISNKRRKVGESKNGMKKFVSGCRRGDDSSCIDEDTVSPLSPSSLPSLEGDALTSQVERMIRITTYVAEMERIHALIRSEMEELTGKSEN